MKKHLAGLAGALAVIGLVAPSAPAQADPSPSSAAAADWVADELETYGLWDYPPFDEESDPVVDYGVNIDAGNALLAGGDTAGAAALRDEIEPGIDEYITGEAFDDTGSTYVNPLAKALAFVQRTGGDTTDFNGVNLVTRLEAQVRTTGDVGRVFDTSTFGDNANMIGQALAAQGLAAAGSDRAGDVLSYLLDQQCADGHFALALPTQATPNPCAGTAGTDVTALVAIPLRDLAGAPVVATALREAAAWVADQQNADGSIPGAPPTTDPNSNTTGLGATLLGAACDVEAARSAAAWVRALQVTTANAQGTQLAGEEGAVGYDQAAFDAAETGGLGTTTAQRDQWRRATAQAGPGLNWDRSAPSPLTLSGPTGFQRGGAVVRFQVGGLADGEPQPCLNGPGTAQILTGATGLVRLPTTTGVARYSASNGPGQVSHDLRVLGARTLPVTVRKTVRAGGRQLVQVRGLVTGENVRVVYRGKVVATGKAAAGGRFARYVPVGTTAGARSIVVQGHFGNRRGTAPFRVTR